MIIRFVFAALLIQVSNFGAVLASEEERRWAKVRDPLIFKGNEMVGAVMIDLNSLLKSSDGWILYQASIKPSSYPYWIEMFVSYEAIHCAHENLASSTSYPRYESSYFHFGKSNAESGMDLAMARKKHHSVCNASNLREIPHTVGQVLALNRQEGRFPGKPTIKYDRAVMLGILKEGDAK